MLPVRVLIVDDSQVVRSLIHDMLTLDPDITVVGEAANGHEAIAMAMALKPSLITMDLQMPVMDGLEAIEHIMGVYAVPILVVSSMADSINAYEAINRGALDVIAKPDFTIESAQDFVAKVKMLAQIRVIRHIRSQSLHTAVTAGKQDTLPISETSATVPAPLPKTPITSVSAPLSTLKLLSAQRHIRVVAIASSTGGPQAIAAILPLLPATFPTPIIIAQHIAAGFAEDMARWLNTLTPLNVVLALHGAVLTPGYVYLAPSEQHLQVNANGRLSLHPHANTDIYRPSCNHLLKSVASVFGNNCMGVILSGMGQDGVLGMQAIRTAGGMTLAQNAATSVIYGMNGQAVQVGAVELELPLGQLAYAMLSMVRQGDNC